MKSIIRNFIAKLLAGRSDDGIMITLKDPKKIDFETAKVQELLMRNGVDPRVITSEEQLKGILNQIESVSKQQTQVRPGKKGIMETKSAKIMDMEGKEIPKGSKIMGGKAVDDDLPPPGSRGGDEDIAAPIQSADESLKDMMEAEIKKKIEAQNKLSAQNLKIKKEYEKAVKEGKFKGTEEDFRNKIDMMMDDIDNDFAQGGIARIGYKKGSIDLARRGFMKAAAGVGAGIGALKMGALKLFGKEGARQATKEIIKTDPIPGKPKWFDALVTKVINEGDDMTKQFATKDREIVHAAKIDDDSYVRVYRDVDGGEIRVEYSNPDNMGGDTIDLVYKKELPDEGNPKPIAEFYAIEPEPRGIRTGPDDYDVEFDGENFANNVDELMSDTTKLKIFAKGDAKPTLKEFVESKKKKDKTKALNESTLEQAEYLETKYGPGPEGPDDFALGGIARMLGE
jgi:hypothetical protein